MQKQLDKAPKELVEKWSKRPVASAFKTGHYQRPPKQEFHLLGYIRYIHACKCMWHAIYMFCSAETSLLSIKRKANSGFINIHANACWLNSVLQLLELSDIPVFLEGLYNHINAIHIAYCIIVGFSDESLSVMQREYRNIHRELDEATTPVDASLLLVKLMFISGPIIAIILIYTLHDFFMHDAIYLQGTLTSIGTNLSFSRMNDAEECISSLINVIFDNMQVRIMHVCCNLYIQAFYNNACKVFLETTCSL